MAERRCEICGRGGRWQHDLSEIVPSDKMIWEWGYTPGLQVVVCDPCRVDDHPRIDYTCWDKGMRLLKERAKSGQGALPL